MLPYLSSPIAWLWAANMSLYPMVEVAPAPGGPAPRKIARSAQRAHTGTSPTWPTTRRLSE